jgi:hypothetical protein
VKVGKLATRRRRIAAVAVAGIVLATGTGVASAYFAPGSQDISSAEGYFTFCADRQRDIAGIEAADLVAANFGIDTYVYEDSTIVVGSTLPSSHPFVLGKSGIQADGVARRVLTAQLLEYDTADAASHAPVQIRCKLRTHESLVRADDDFQKLDTGALTSVPWGFGAASGPSKTCPQVQEELVASVWNSLTPEQQAASPYKYGTSSLVLGPENNRGTGTAWTGGVKVASAAAGVLTINDWSLIAPSTVSGFPDRLLGAHYCVFVAPEYLRAVLLGEPVV